jgi:hypothetical protein
LKDYDIVAAQRGAFLRLNEADALSLLGGVEKGEFGKLTVVTAAEQREASEKERLDASEIAADVSSGSRGGFGLIFLKSSSSNVCMVVGDKTEALTHLLLAKADKLALEMRGNPTISRATAEETFVSLKQSRCGAVYASAADLKSIAEGLARDGIAFTFANVWMTSDDIDAADAGARESHRVVEQRETERRQRAADQQRLEAQRKADQSATSKAQEDALRLQYGGAAQAEVASIVDEVKAWTSGQHGNVGTSYPAYAAWLTERLSDHWDVMTFNSELADFGVSEFKGRKLDTPFARVSVRLKNRILGEYEDACFLFGHIVDAEFSMNREPFVGACDDAVSFKRWKDGHQFQSLWIVGG